MAEEIRRNDTYNLSPYAGLLILEDRLAKVESICLTASIPTAKVKGDRSQPTAIKRIGRVDRLRFGWRLDPHDDKRLLPDREEQETIRRAQFLAAADLSLREICRRLDQEGRGRRGKKWEGSHSVLRTILLRNKQP
ncbi:MAG: recombinase family protein [Thermoguttaceae bacterium]